MNFCTCLGHLPRYAHLFAFISFKYYFVMDMQMNFDIDITCSEKERIPINIV